jgi:hypothetical protein
MLGAGKVLTDQYTIAVFHFAQDDVTPLHQRAGLEPSDKPINATDGFAGVVG